MPEGSLTRTPVAAGSALFPPREERRRLDDRLTDALLAAETRVAAGPVTPTIDLAAFGGELDGFDFTVPLPHDALLHWTIARLEEGVTQ
jgi:hypothetical protein